MFRFPPCLFHLATGYYCPGCGGTRAITALLHGQILNSFLYHPVVLYSAGLFLRIFVVSGLGAVRSGHFSCSKKLRKYDIFWILFLTTAHFLIINGCKLFLGLDLFKQIRKIPCFLAKTRSRGFFHVRSPVPGREKSSDRHRDLSRMDNRRKDCFHKESCRCRDR